MLKPLIELDQKIDGVAPLARNRTDQFHQSRTRGLRIDEGGKVFTQLGGERKRPRLRIRLDEKIEGIDHFQVGDEIDRDGKFFGPLREDETREPITVRVLLPVHEVLGGLHRQRIAGNAGAAMRCRPQPYDLRPETDRPGVIVARCVVKPDKNGHAVTRYQSIFGQETRNFHAISGPPSMA